MANVDYATELRRDSSLYEKVNTITEKYFSTPIKKPNQMQAMLNNFLSGGGLGGGGGGVPGFSNALM